MTDKPDILDRLSNVERWGLPFDARHALIDAFIEIKHLRAEVIALRDRGGQVTEGVAADRNGLIREFWRRFEDPKGPRAYGAVAADIVAADRKRRVVVTDEVLMRVHDIAWDPQGEDSHVQMRKALEAFVAAMSEPQS